MRKSIEKTRLYSRLIFPSWHLTYPNFISTHICPAASHAYGMSPLKKQKSSRTPRGLRMDTVFEPSSTTLLNNHFQLFSTLTMIELLATATLDASFFIHIVCPLIDTVHMCWNFHSVIPLNLDSLTKYYYHHQQISHSFASAFQRKKLSNSSTLSSYLIIRKWPNLLAKRYRILMHFHFIDLQACPQNSSSTINLGFFGTNCSLHLI